MVFGCSMRVRCSVCGWLVCVVMFVCCLIGSMLYWCGFGGMVILLLFLMFWCLLLFSGLLVGSFGIVGFRCLRWLSSVLSLIGVRSCLRCWLVGMLVVVGWCWFGLMVWLCWIGLLFRWLQ